jgi:surface protein
MNHMFYGATAFNKNISGWNVASVTPKPPTGFSSGSALTAQNSPVWGIYAYTSHTFTTADVSGRTGPTLSAVRTAYANAGATWASSHVNMTSDNGIQLWTVPVTGSYTIRAVGAGVPYNSTGTNAMNEHQTGMDITITTTLTRGEVIKILVGQQPILTQANGAGGAGGTFVVRGTQTPIIVAGGGGGRGGGGCNSASNANNAPAGKSGHGSVNNPTYQKGILGGSGGNSGNGGDGRGNSGGGGGLIGNGSSNGGLSFTNGGLGGPSNSVSTAGGFGGGGSGEVGQEGSGGGGGGYSGGGGGGQFFNALNYLLNPNNPANFFATSGGGGGSYILDGTTMTVNGYNSGHGYVQITYLSS